jgi:hypothetical protein
MPKGYKETWRRCYNIKIAIFSIVHKREKVNAAVPEKE